MKWGLSSRTAIGLDIGRRTMKAAQLSDSGEHLVALSLLPRPTAEKNVCREDVLALKAVLRRQGFKGNRIVIAASNQAILPASLELPVKVGGAQLEQIIRMELSRLHNIAPDSFEMAYWDLKAADDAKPVTHTLAMACPHEPANAMLDVFENAGFRVVAMDVRGAAAARACAPLLLAAPQVTAIMDLGWHSTSLLFVCGQSLIYERSMEGASIAELVAKLAEVFNIPLELASQVLAKIGPATEETAEQFDRVSRDAIRRHLRTHFDRLIDTLKVPLSYAKHQFPGDGVKRMLLIGGGAVIPDLASHFEARLGFEVKRAGPAELTEVRGPLAGRPELSAKASNPALTIAVGLARFKRAF